MGHRVKELRNKAGFTRDELADSAGLSREVVRSVERGERDSIPLPALLALAGVLGAPFAALEDAAKAPGERLRAARRQRGLTIQELARESGLTETHISDLELGKKVLMRLPPANALATALGLLVLYLAPWLAETSSVDD